MKFLKAIIFFIGLCTCKCLVCMDPQPITHPIEYYEAPKHYDELLAAMRPRSNQWKKLPDYNDILTADELDAIFGAYHISDFSILFLSAGKCSFCTRTEARHKLLLNMMRTFDSAIDRFNKIKSTETSGGSENVELSIPDEVRLILNISEGALFGGISQIAGLNEQGFSSREDISKLAEFSDVFGFMHAKLYAQNKCLQQCIHINKDAWNELYRKFLVNLDNFTGYWILNPRKVMQAQFEKFWESGFGTMGYLLDLIKKCAGTEFNSTNFPKYHKFFKDFFDAQKIKLSKPEPTPDGVDPSKVDSKSAISVAVPSVLLIAAACGGGYYFYNKNRNNKRKRSSSVDHQKKENQGDDVVEQVAN